MAMKQVKVNSYVESKFGFTPGAIYKVTHKFKDPFFGWVFVIKDDQNNDRKVLEESSTDYNKLRV
jgi:hypothetical protein